MGKRSCERKHRDLEILHRDWNFGFLSFEALILSGFFFLFFLSKKPYVSEKSVSHMKQSQIIEIGTGIIYDWTGKTQGI